MEFKAFRDRLKEHFTSMTKDVNVLFQVDMDKTLLWEKYLGSFPAGTNPMYRQRTEYDCSACRSFIKRMGNVVSIKGGVVTTIWDFETGSTTFQPVVDALSAYVKSQAVTDVWFSKEKSAGVEKNHEDLGNGNVETWYHMHLDIPSKYVDRTSKSIGEILGSYRDTKNVFKRSLDELTEDSVLTVLELIAQNSLYKGEEWKTVLQEFRRYQLLYANVPEDKKDLFAWEQSLSVGMTIGRIRNHSIGTLLIDISKGEDLDEAVKSYERIVAPTNYKRPNAIFTKKMLDDAKKTLEDLGYMTALERRYADLDDIRVNNILFSNRDAAKRIIGGGIFEEMASALPVNPKTFSKVEEISIDNFIQNVLPSAREIEVLFESKHANSMVSLIAPRHLNSNNMFKWNNRFSWAYTGNMTDSYIKANVKSAGGKIDGVLRFSIQWNDENEHDRNDLDAHCSEPGGNIIYYANKINRNTTGQLDVDITSPIKDVPAVENITWIDRNKMGKGTYKFSVYNFCHRGGKGGFRAEIEFDGQLYSFSYNKELKQSETVQVAEVFFNGTDFTIVEKLPSSTSSREVWGLNTNQFIPVSIIMYSPNYWDEQDGIGHRHYFFMLKECINPESPNGFYNEFLKSELLTHKRVFEALGSKMRVEDTMDQLSGIGFSSTKRADIIVRIKGQSERVLKVKI
jgi:hypothetical protein